MLLLSGQYHFELSPNAQAMQLYELVCGLVIKKGSILLLGNGVNELLITTIRYFFQPNLTSLISLNLLYHDVHSLSDFLLSVILRH